ncbi:MAG TPA: GNAT family N-acetyltransferase [bacterium]|nr:GNAT family N-acetyltransferase [bacterium]
MLDVVLRKATDEDIPLLVEMRLALQKHLEVRDPEAPRFSPRGLRLVMPEISARLRKSNCYIAVAETKTGEPVGMMMAEAVSDSYRVPSSYGHIHWLYIVEDARMNGIGRKLVKLACRFFEKHDIEQVTMGYVYKNTEAEKFWAALGFKPTVVHTSANLRNLLDTL